MKFNINHDFKVIVIPNKFNTFSPSDTAFSFKAEEVITSKDKRYDLLVKMMEGDLLPIVEYQVVAVANIIEKSSNKVVGISTFNFTEFSQLEGINEYQYPFLEVVEE